MNIQPLFDRVLIKRQDDEEVSAGGIVIPDSAKEKTHRGEVIARGAGRILDDGKTRNVSVKVGDRVLFEKYAGTEIKLDGNEHLIVREDDILGVIN
jgi:chaperonin GroES